MAKRFGLQGRDGGLVRVEDKGRGETVVQTKLMTRSPYLPPSPGRPGAASQSFSKAKIELDISINEFKKIKCTKCNKIINSKNVIFEEE